uniref:Uncharacterized protein n=1 Tax=Tetranychus urticae TaxID=32264 RepID=T1KU35_TETUR
MCSQKLIRRELQAQRNNWMSGYGFSNIYEVFVRKICVGPGIEFDETNLTAEIESMFAETRLQSKICYVEKRGEIRVVGFAGMVNGSAIVSRLADRNDLVVSAPSFTPPSVYFFLEGDLTYYCVKELNDLFFRANNFIKDGNTSIVGRKRMKIAGLVLTKVTMNITGKNREKLLDHDGKIHFRTVTVRCYDDIKLEFCLNCLRFGHGVNSCSNKTKCAVCLNEHDDVCTPNGSMSTCCTVCPVHERGGHLTFSVNCPSYQRAVELNLKRYALDYDWVMVPNNIVYF